MPHPKVRLMRETLGELLRLAAQARDKREADRILYMYERGEITRQEAIDRLKILNGEE